MSQTKLADWDLIEATGSDREKFFQGQTTNDLLSLSHGEAQLTARLNRVGKLQSYFFLARMPDKLLILCPKKLSSSILEDFSKFIIMDDVELRLWENADLYLLFNPCLSNDETKIMFRLEFYGMLAGLCLGPLVDVAPTDLEQLEKARILNGFPLWDKDVDSSMFINDSHLNATAISYKKGCFLGQETVAKIENNRGAAYYPVLLRPEASSPALGDHFDLFLDGKKVGAVNYQVEELLQANLLRDLRVEGKKLKLTTGIDEFNATVEYLPFFKNKHPVELCQELYHLGVECFQQGNLEEAMNFMRQAITFDYHYCDAYESIGVILGRQGRFIEAIEWMDKLLLINPSSVMAHTNKSLFLMKMGKISEAEAEKALAMVQSFAVHGEEARLKKVQLEEKKKKEEEINRREKMFQQVLELDADDKIALFGMADVAFYRGEYAEAITKLSKVIALDPKYSTAFVLLGKSYEALGSPQSARTIYEQGIEVASKQGDMMPANEMQSRLNQLV